MVRATDSISASVKFRVMGSPGLLAVLGVGAALAFCARDEVAVSPSAASQTMISTAVRGTVAMAQRGEIRFGVIESSTHFDDGARAIALSDDVQ
jgi:hypothetical protein